jgi:hypothetical protein
MNPSEALFSRNRGTRTGASGAVDRLDEESAENEKIEKEDQIFVPFSERKTHWGDKDDRPCIKNVATVLPPGLPPPILKILLLRMQLEEALYNAEHLETAANYVVWCEESLDAETWRGRIKKALESKAKEIIAEEIRTILGEIDELYPNILPVIH